MKGVGIYFWLGGREEDGERDPYDVKVHDEGMVLYGEVKVPDGMSLDWGPALYDLHIVGQHGTQQGPLVCVLAKVLHEGESPVFDPVYFPAVQKALASIQHPFEDKDCSENPNGVRGKLVVL